VQGPPWPKRNFLHQVLICFLDCSWSCTMTVCNQLVSKPLNVTMGIPCIGEQTFKSYNGFTFAFHIGEQTFIILLLCVYPLLRKWC
jgi:hypothetical protein